MNYWIRLSLGQTPTVDIFFENTVRDWSRLRTFLERGYVIVEVRKDK